MERIYKQEELESMNYIFGKEKDNKVFTKTELEFVGNANLCNQNLIQLVKLIWDNRNNKEALDYFQQVMYNKTN